MKPVDVRTTNQHTKKQRTQEPIMNKPQRADNPAAFDDNNNNNATSTATRVGNTTTIDFNIPFSLADTAIYAVSKGLMGGFFP